MGELYPVCPETMNVEVRTLSFVSPTLQIEETLRQGAIFHVDFEVLRR
jgi:hypothetical protein